MFTLSSKLCVDLIRGCGLISPDSNQQDPGCLFFWVCPKLKLLTFSLYFGCSDILSCQLVCTVHCLFSSTWPLPSLTKTLGVLMSHTANKFKSSTEATFFTQSFSAESSDCCFNDFFLLVLFQGSISIF